jgi:predicted DNA-binding transcriptional regulator AlpA
MKKLKAAQATETAIVRRREPGQLATTPAIAIGRLESDEKPVLLTSPQLAAKLAVPPSWVREKTRERARKRDEDPLPVVRLGKYVRFDWSAVSAWLARQSAR